MSNAVYQLSEAIRRERVARARRMSLDARLSESGALFDYACSITLSGIRQQYPGISEDAALDELRRRLAIAERREARQTTHQVETERDTQ